MQKITYETPNVSSQIKYGSTSVSNGTGQSNFSGQSNRSSFIALPRDKGTTGQAQNLAKDWNRLRQPVKIQDGTWDGTL